MLPKPINNIYYDTSGDVQRPDVVTLSRTLLGHTLAGAFRSLSGLTADTALTYTAGQDGTVAAGQMIVVGGTLVYEVAASGASDQHLTTAGGVKIYEAGLRFTVLDRFKAAVARGNVWRTGENVHAADKRYTFLDDGNTTIAGLTGWSEVSIAGHTHSLASLTGGGDMARLMPNALRISDWNTAIESGFYANDATGAANQPESGWFLGLTVAWNSTYLVQTIAEYINTTDPRRWRRSCNNGVWTAWERVLETEGEILSLFDQTMIVRDQKANGTNAQTLTAGVWDTRHLNTVAANTIGGASLSSNEVTLPIGTFDLDLSAPAYRSNGSVARIYDVTNAAVLGVTSSGYGHSSFNNLAECTLKTRIALTAPASLRVEQIVLSASFGGASAGFISGNSEPEIYTQLKIRKVV